MISQDDLRTGFDIELLMGEEYIKYLLLSGVETGDFPTTIGFTTTFGSANATVAALIKVPEEIRRTYTPNGGAALLTTTSLNAFGIEMLADATGADLRITLITDMTITIGNLPPVTLTDVDLLIDLTASVSGNNSLSLTTVLVDSTDTTLAALLADPATQAAAVAQINTLISSGLGSNLFGSAGSVQTVQISKFTDDPGTRALGVYINTLLRNGFDDDDVAAERGDVDEAVNFLPEGQHFAFGVNSNLFALLEDHIRVLVAESMNEGSDDFYLKLNGTTIGYLTGVSVDVVQSRYDTGPREKSDPMNALRIKAKINAIPYGADVAIEYYLFPVLGSDKLVTWETQTDVDVDLLFEFLPLFLILIVSVINPIAGAVFGQILSTVLLAASGPVSDYIAWELEQGNDMSQTDSLATLTSILPQRVDISARRWDPFYTTNHQLLVPFEFFELEDDGMVACGLVQLANQYVPVSHVVIRDEERSGDEVSRLRYRVNDFNPADPDYTAVFYATDREAWTVETGDAEPDILSLSMSEVTDRIAEDKLRSNIVYKPQMVDIRDHQVKSILAISETEISEGNSDDLRFDLSPQEFAGLQANRVAYIRGFDVVEREGVPYYRDDADSSIENNLMSLPGYSSDDV